MKKNHIIFLGILLSLAQGQCIIPDEVESSYLSDAVKKTRSFDLMDDNNSIDQDQAGWDELPGTDLLPTEEQEAGLQQKTAEAQQKLEDAKRDKAATTIQKALRGKLARLKAEQLRAEKSQQEGAIPRGTSLPFDQQVTIHDRSMVAQQLLVDQADIQLLMPHNVQQLLQQGDKENALTAIKRIWRQQALAHHPDRHADQSREVQKNAAERFKQLQQAYDVVHEAVNQGATTPTQVMQLESSDQLLAITDNTAAQKAAGLQQKIAEAQQKLEDAKRNKAATTIQKVLRGKLARLKAKRRKIEKATPLHQAVDQGSSNMAYSLIMSGADTEARDADGFTPLQKAHWNGDATMAYSIRQGYLDKSLHDAVDQQDTEKARHLVNQGADIHAQDAEGYSALNKAQWSGDLEMENALFGRYSETNV